MTVETGGDGDKSVGETKETPTEAAAGPPAEWRRRPAPQTPLVGWVCVALMVLITARVLWGGCGHAHAPEPQPVTTRQKRPPAPAAHRK